MTFNQHFKIYKHNVYAQITKGQITKFIQALMLLISGYLNVEKTS
jgi:hypothetical protein